jgi:hypothetical protein
LSANQTACLLSLPESDSMPHPGLHAAWFVASALLVAASASAEDVSATSQQGEFFEKSIRPVLVASCQDCHGPQKQQGGLRLDSREAVLAGGDSGPAVVLGTGETGGEPAD